MCSALESIGEAAIVVLVASATILVWRVSDVPGDLEQIILMQ